MSAIEHEALVELAGTHVRAEQVDDIDTTLSTLDDDPIYELQPIGRVMRGMDKARRYYQHFFSNFKPLTDGIKLRGQWVTAEGVGQEYTIWLRLPDGTRERHDVIGLLTFGSSGKLSGERVYASERLLRLMFGPLLDETEPITAAR